MNIVIFDGYTINPGDLSWKKIEDLCDRLTVFDATPEDKALLRLGSSEAHDEQMPYNERTHGKMS